MRSTVVPDSGLTPGRSCCPDTDALGGKVVAAHLRQFREYPCLGFSLDQNSAPRNKQGASAIDSYVVRDPAQIVD